MTGRTRRSVAGGATVLIVLAVVAIVADGSSSVPTALGAIKLPSQPGPIARHLESLSGLNDISARPLFMPARRPAPPATAAKVVAEVASPRVRPTLPVSGLVATLIGPGRRIAVVRLSTGKTSVLAEGDNLDDWVLGRVSPDGVVFRAGPDETTIVFAAHAAHGPGGTAFAQATQSSPKKRR